MSSEEEAESLQNTNALDEQVLYTVGLAGVPEASLSITYMDCKDSRRFPDSQLQVRVQSVAGLMHDQGKMCYNVKKLPRGHAW